MDLRSLLYKFTCKWLIKWKKYYNKSLISANKCLNIVVALLVPWLNAKVLIIIFWVMPFYLIIFQTPTKMLNCYSDNYILNVIGSQILIYLKKKQNWSLIGEHLLKGPNKENNSTFLFNCFILDVLCHCRLYNTEKTHSTLN